MYGIRASAPSRSRRAIPVYVTYQTAFVDDAGARQARADIYGLDKRLTPCCTASADVADVPVARNYSSSSTPVPASGVATAPPVAHVFAVA